MDICRKNSTSSSGPEENASFDVHPGSDIVIDMINPPKRQDDYPDRHIHCQEAMEPGLQAIVDCMLEAGWHRGETFQALRQLVAAAKMAQQENARLEAELAILRAQARAGREPK